MNGLMDKLNRELEIRNFSKKTVKSYLFSVEKFLEFSVNRGLGLNEDAVKDYLQARLKKQNPSTVDPSWCVG